MISEPELTGDPDDFGAEVLSDADRPPRRWRPRGGRQAWAWGLGGVLLASLVWGGGLRWWDAHHDGRPDLHGYVLGDSPCAGGTLGPLTSALGASDTAVVTPTAARLGRALDQARCTLALYVPDSAGGVDRFEVSVTVDLHKRTDPRPEFDDLVAIDDRDLTAVPAVHRLRGIGDEAVLRDFSGQSEQLQVLHGGAVFGLTLTGYAGSPVSEDTLGALHGGPRTAVTDVSRFEPSLVSAMRNVMNGQHPHRG